MIDERALIVPLRALRGWTVGNLRAGLRVTLKSTDQNCQHRQNQNFSHPTSINFITLSSHMVFAGISWPVRENRKHYLSSKQFRIRRSLHYDETANRAISPHSNASA